MKDRYRPGLPIDPDAAHPWDPDSADQDRQAKDEAVVNAGFWRKVRGTIGRVPFVEDAVAAWYCARDDRTPRYARATILGALAYFVMPIDTIPDLVAVFGFTDDATVIAAALAAIRSNMTADHRNKARMILDKPEQPDDDGPVLT